MDQKILTFLLWGVKLYTWGLLWGGLGLGRHKKTCFQPVACAVFRVKILLPAQSRWRLWGAQPTSTPPQQSTRWQFKSSANNRPPNTPPLPAGKRSQTKCVRELMHASKKLSWGLGIQINVEGGGGTAVGLLATLGRRVRVGIHFGHGMQAVRDGWAVGRLGDWVVGVIWPLQRLSVCSRRLFELVTGTGTRA